MVQAHKRKIEKRVYSVGEVIEIPTMQKVVSGFRWYYKTIIKSFRINRIGKNNELIGEYL
jgi:hypothetical protein